MSRTRIKICGLYREQHVDYVNAAGPDYAGFVFYPPSHRYVDREMMKRLREKLEGVSDQWRLKTVWGVGYKFETAAGQSAEKKA